MDQSSFGFWLSNHFLVLEFLEILGILGSLRPGGLEKKTELV